MNTVEVVAGLGLSCALLLPIDGHPAEARATGSPQRPGRPGDIERAALDRASFLVGEWEGEGWQLTGSGQRVRLWVKESYRYRGDRDLLDMEGRSGVLLPDGTRSSERHYALGILYYDRTSDEYRMWHYSDDGEVFTATLDVDIGAKAGEYTRQRVGGGSSRFSVKIGDDGVWVSKVEAINTDNTSLEVVEFRMKRNE